MLYLHGWLLWGAWGVLGFMQIVSIRYMRTFTACDRIIKNFNMLLHITGGIIILATTITMSVLAIQKFEWVLNWDKNLHSAFGLAVLFAVCLVTVLGFVAWGGILYGSGGKSCWR
jgi:hypothetical protein